MLYDKIAPFLARTYKECFEPGNDKHRQICSAVSAARGKLCITEVQLKNLCYQVSKAISPFSVDLEDWLHSQGLLYTIAHLDADTQRQQVQAYRHRWLKHLCEEYERENTVR